MKVLIIEDTESKRIALRDFVISNYKDALVTEADSFQDGNEKIRLGPYDLVLLDMTMPTFSITTEDMGGKKRPFAGRDLISKMQRRGYLFPVVVVTRFDVFPDTHRTISLTELHENLKFEFPDIYKGYVFYNNSKTTWAIELKQIISAVLKKSIK